MTSKIPNFAEIKLYNDYMYDAINKKLIAKNISPISDGGLMILYDSKNQESRDKARRVLQTANNFRDVMYGYSDVNDAISGNALLADYIGAVKFPTIAWYDGNTHQIYRFDGDPTDDFKELFDFIMTQSGKKMRFFADNINTNLAIR